GAGRGSGTRWRTTSAPSRRAAGSRPASSVGFQVGDEPGRDEEPEEDPDERGVHGRLGEEPPEALPVRMKEREPPRLHERPCEARERNDGTDREHDADPR